LQRRQGRFRKQLTDRIVDLIADERDIGHELRDGRDVEIKQGQLRRILIDDGGCSRRGLRRRGARAILRLPDVRRSVACGRIVRVRARATR
jgi:hypothetical protein